MHFRNDELRDGRGGRLLARHVAHDWVVDGRRYLRLDCSAPVDIAVFDDAGKASYPVEGPHQHFSSVDGIAFADREVFAHLDTPSQRWYVLSIDADFPDLLVTPVSERELREMPIS